LVITAIGLLTAGFVKLYDSSQTLRAGISGVFNSLKTVVTNVLQGLANQIVGFGRIFEGLFTLDYDKITQGATQFAKGFTQTFTKAGRGAGNAFKQGFNERINRETFEGLGEEVSAAIDQQSEQIRDEVNSKIVEALEAGKITSAQADELQAKLIENFDPEPVTPEIPLVPTLEADLQPARKTLDQLRSELALLEKGFTGTNDERERILELKGQISDLEAIIKVDSGSLTEAQKDADRLRESLESFRIQLQVERAGGSDSIGGQNILEQERIAELEANKAFQALRIKSEQDAAAVLLPERLKFAEARARITDGQTSETLMQQRITEIESIRETNAFKTASIEDQKRIETAIETSFNSQIERLRESELQKDIQRITARTRSEEEAVAKRIAIATDELTQQNIVQAQRLQQAFELEQLSVDQRKTLLESFTNEKKALEASAFIEEGDFAAARKLIEEDVTASKVAAQTEYLRKVLEVNKTVRDENAAILSSLQFLADTGALDEAGQKELEARRALQEKLNKAILDGEKALQDSLTKQAKEGLETRETDERESVERRIQTGFSAIDQILESTVALTESLKQVFEALADGGDNLGERLASAAQGALGVISGFYALQAQSFEQAKQRELNAAGDNADKREQIERRYAEQSKRIQKAQAVIGAAQAVVSIFAAPAILPQPADFILKLGLSTAVAAQTAKQIQVIDSAGFKEGVVNLQGAGTETSDSIPARLSKGETVVTAKQTRRHIDLLTQIHKGRVLKPVELVKGRPPVYGFDDDIVKDAQELSSSQGVYQDNRLEQTKFVMQRPDILLAQPNSSTYITQQSIDIDYRKLADTLAPRMARETVNKSERQGGLNFQMLREMQNSNAKLYAEMKKLNAKL